MDKEKYNEIYDAIKKIIYKYKKVTDITFERPECAYCKDQIRIEDFTDELSLREFEISGLCQDCQNDVFKGE